MTAPIDPEELGTEVAVTVMLRELYMLVDRSLGNNSPGLPAMRDNVLAVLKRAEEITRPGEEDFTRRVVVAGKLKVSEVFGGIIDKP